MQPGSRLEEAGEWIRFAQDDLETAQAMLRVAPPRLRAALFHAQQAAEKALKGFLVYHGVTSPITYHVGVLLDLCSRIDPSLDEALGSAVELTQFAVRFRYPGEPDVPTPEETRQWVETAAGVVRHVRERLPEF